MTRPALPRTAMTMATATRLGAAKLLKCSEPTIKRGLARIKAAKGITHADAT